MPSSDSAYHFVHTVKLEIACMRACGDRHSANSCACDTTGMPVGPAQSFRDGLHDKPAWAWLFLERWFSLLVVRMSTVVLSSGTLRYDWVPMEQIPSRSRQARVPVAMYKDTHMLLSVCAHRHAACLCLSSCCMTCSVSAAPGCTVNAVSTRIQNLYSTARPSAAAAWLAAHWQRRGTCNPPCHYTPGARRLK